MQLTQFKHYLEAVKRIGVPFFASSLKYNSNIWNQSHLDLKENSVLKNYLVHEHTDSISYLNGRVGKVGFLQLQASS